MNSIFQKIKNKILSLDYFNLFYAFLFYLLILFWFVPLSFYLDLPSQYVKYFKNNNFSFDNWFYYLLTLLGLVSFIFGFKLVKNWKIKKLDNLFEKEWDYKKTIFVYFLLFLLGIFLKLNLYFNGSFFHINQNIGLNSNSFSSAIRILSWSSFFALSLAFCLYFYFLKIGNKHYKFWRIIAWFNFGLELLLGFLSQSKYLFLVPIFIYLISKHYFYKKSLKRLIIAFLLIVFIIFPLFNYYRNPIGILYYKKQVDYNLEFNIKKQVDHNLEFNIESVAEYTVDSSFYRITSLYSLYAAIDKTENFLWGKNIKDFFISFGPPKFIWKDKPSINDGGNEFGRKYGLLAPNDSTTSIAPTVFGDWYINFGILGVIFGMILEGIIIGLVYNTFIKDKKLLPAHVFIYSILWINILKEFEGFSAPAYALIIKLFIMIILIQLFLTQNLTSLFKFKFKFKN